MFNSGSVNCREFVEFVTVAYMKILIKNINIKKQTSENKIQYVDSDNSNIKNRLKQKIKFRIETLKANKAIVNVLKEGKKRLILDFVLC